MPTNKNKQVPMHIALFLPALNEGGAERVMVNLANAFESGGHRVDLVLAQRKGPYLAEVSNNVNVIDLASARVLSALFPLIKYLRHARPDVVLSTLAHANIVAIVASRLSFTKTPVVVREAALPTLDKKQQLGSKPTGFMRMAQMLYPYAKAVVCVSSGVKSEMIEYLQIDHRVPHTVIYNPVIADRLTSKANASIDPEFKALYELPVVLGVGRLSDEKDFATLIKAFAKVRTCVNANLLILGSGDLLDTLETLAHQLEVDQHVFFAGFKSNPYPYIKHASLFVLSSKSEGLPNSLIESIALGTPVVSTMIANGPGEILDNGKWGALVPVGNVELMAEKMTDALKGTANVTTPDENWFNRFSDERVVQQYLDLLSSHTANPNHR